MSEITLKYRIFSFAVNLFVNFLSVLKRVDSTFQMHKTSDFRVLYIKPTAYLTYVSIALFLAGAYKLAAFRT